MKKRYFLSAFASLLCLMMSAADLTGKRIYVNPGHGSFGANDRPMATIPFPNLKTTGMPDTCGFYETNTNLWKCLYLGKRLEQAGAYVMYSRKQNGPWPYTMVDGDYPDYTREGYNALPDIEKYNRNLSEICEEVEANNMDLFISVHSNANTDGTTANYPLWLYRGTDAAPTDFEKESKAVGAAIWPYRFAMMAAGYDQASSYTTSQNLRGDINFYGSSSTRHSAVSGKDYTGYLGVLKHGTIGGLFEGYFHTYQPARHRALNHDHCHMEGYSYYQGIIDYFGADKDTKGYILGTVKDLHEKISHPLFNYAPKTNDQWLPCNGAVVTLYKAGAKVADYKVDDFFNGVFYFGDLEPGEDYTLDATCDGYFPLYKEYKTPIKVEANKVVFPMIFLEGEDYEQAKEVYYTYPEPLLPPYVSLASSYTFSSPSVKSADALQGKTIRRTIIRDSETMYVLALDESNDPYLYLINPKSMTVTATLPTDFCTVSPEGKLRLSDIAVTAEGVLIGCNEEKTTFTPSNKWLVYKWTVDDSGAWTGEVWLNNTTNETAGNFSNAISGSTLAYAGTLDEGTLYSTAYTIGSDAHAVRYFLYTISGGNYAGALRNQDASHKLTEMGDNIRFTISPLADNKVIITNDSIAPIEWEVVNATAQAPKLTVMSDDFKGMQGVGFFKYAKHSLMVAPATADAKNVGLVLYDVTDGIDKPRLLTTNTALDAANTVYAAAAATVAEEDIALWLVKDNSVTYFTTSGVSQPLPAHISAYNLQLTYNESEQEYTFTYTASADAVATDIVFYQEGFESGRQAVAPAKKGVNTVVIKKADLPIFSGSDATWAVSLRGENVATWGKVFADNSMLVSSTTRVFNTVDNNPESDYFGRLYIMRRAGSSASADRPKNGIFVYNPDYTPVNTELLKGGVEFGNPTRLSVASDGYVFQADWADGYSGVYVINPADLNGSFTQFFQGDRNSAGVFTNGGTAVGSSTPGLNVYGSGADTKLVVYNEDASGTLPANGLVIYNIGQPDGSILHSWGEAPSAVIPLTKQANTEGTPVATSHGVFVSQVRSAGNNNSAAPSLMFYDYSGNCLLSSDLEPYKDIIDGSNGGGYAVSADESLLVLNGGSKQFYVFDIIWNGDTPQLRLRYEYEHGITAIRQMNFDFAGNLICSGESGITIFTLPTDENITTIPAKKALTVNKGAGGTAVEGVILSEKTLALKRGETCQLQYAVMPVSSVNKDITWETTDPAVATVADGLITAVASGQTTITIRTAEGNFSAVCQVSVTTPVLGVSLDIQQKEVQVGETFSLKAIVNPEDADNVNVLWETSSSKVAQVNNGEVFARKAGEAVITVTTEDGGYTASCKVTVKPVSVTGVTLSEESLTLNIGEQTQLVATVQPDNAADKSVTWSSSNESVVTVTEGFVQALAPGEAVITVTTTDGSFTATCLVTVNPILVTAIELNMYELDLNEGETFTLVATLVPDNATDRTITWSSSDEAVATVVDGVVTAAAEGEAVITVTSVSGASTVCNVRVTRIDDGLEALEASGIYYRDGIICNGQGLPLAVFDLQGRCVAQGNGDINLTMMPSAVYIIRAGNLSVKVVR